MHSFVLVGEVEEAAVVGDRDALDARQGRKFADELAFERARVLVRRERAAEVGRHSVLAAGVVLNWADVRKYK